MDSEEPRPADAKSAEITGRIVDRFGGIRPMAAKLDAPVTTVQGWKKRGIIPQTRHADILGAAARTGIALDPAELAETDPGGAAGRAELRAVEAATTAAPPPVPIRRRGRGLALAVSIVALILVLGGGAAAWRLYLSPLEARVAALEESAAAAAAGRPSAAHPTNAADERIAALEQQVDDIKAGSAKTEQLARQLSDLQVAAGGHELLAQSIRDIQASTTATQGEVERLGNQLAALGARLDQVDTALAARRQQGLRSEAVLLAVGQLRAALSESKPFPKELAAVRALVGDDADMQGILDQVQPYADDGVRTLDELRADFAKLAPQIVRSAAVGDGSSWLRQTLYRIESVVSIRRVGDSVPGDAADAVVARAEAKLDADDLKGAVAGLAALNGLPAEVAAPWIHDAEQRIAADAADADLSRLAISRVATGDAAAAAPASPPSQ